MVSGDSMPISNAVSKMLVCIDDVSHFELSGKLLSPYIQDIILFRSVKELLDKMEQFFDQTGYPQPYYTYRNFSDNKAPASKTRRPEPKIIRYHDDMIFDNNSGQIATFQVHVLFKQNASWQGNIRWVKKNIARDFRSTLELIKLMEECVVDFYPAQ